MRRFFEERFGSARPADSENFRSVAFGLALISLALAGQKRDRPETLRCRRRSGLTERTRVSTLRRYAFTQSPGMVNDHFDIKEKRKRAS